MDGLRGHPVAYVSLALKTGRTIPIIALTGYAMDGDKDRFLAAGMDDYIAKPVCTWLT